MSFAEELARHNKDHVAQTAGEIVAYLKGLPPLKPYQTSRRSFSSASLDLGLLSREARYQGYPKNFDDMAELIRQGAMPATMAGTLYAPVWTDLQPLRSGCTATDPLAWCLKQNKHYPVIRLRTRQYTTDSDFITGAMIAVLYATAIDLRADFEDKINGVLGVERADEIECVYSRPTMYVTRDAWSLTYVAGMVIAGRARRTEVVADVERPTAERETTEAA